MSQPRWTVGYYQGPNGEPVVEQEMKAFGPKAFARILRTIGLVEEFGIELGGDYVDHIEGKIWELRVSSYRVLYFAFHRRQFVLLRAFMKKTQKTPRKEIKTAEGRLADHSKRFG